MSETGIPFVFRPAASGIADCKCCGTRSPLFGVADFNKNCLTRDPQGPLCGIPVYYYRCPQCKFIFTTALDQFTPQEFLERIYNADYARIDPDYADIRPRHHLQWVKTLFGQSKDLRILDFGGGSGLLAKLLREEGFKQAICYDPFVPEFSHRPEGPFDLILSFEVFEHAPNPHQLVSTIDSLLVRTGGMVLFSTLLQPVDIEKQGVGWWYIAPRNGHVSIYTKPALQYLAKRFELNTGSTDELSHVFFRDIPPFARHLFGL